MPSVRIILDLTRANALESKQAKGGEADAARVRALTLYKNSSTSGKMLTPGYLSTRQSKPNMASYWQRNWDLTHISFLNSE